MGIALSLFRGKPSTRDTLERIEQEIQNIEEKRWDRIKREKLAVQIFSFIPMTILIANVCLLLYPSEATWRDKFIYSVPIAIFNLILWSCKRFIQWYSHWSQDNEEARLRKLQKEKKRILEKVCENESYKVASELLEKYDPKQLRYREKAVERNISPLNNSLSRIKASPIRPASPSQQSRIQQNLMTTLLNQSVNLPTPHNLSIVAPPPPPPTPAAKLQLKKSKLNTTSNNLLNTSLPNHNVAASSVQGRPVRPILSKDRGMLEKLVDWVVADGPDNRFALICRHCYGHNGMSLAEEFETINFRCCYCYNLNSASTRPKPTPDQPRVDREESDNKESENKVPDHKESDPETTPSIKQTDCDKEDEEDKPKEKVPEVVNSQVVGC